MVVSLELFDRRVSNQYGKASAAHNAFIEAQVDLVENAFAEAVQDPDSTLTKHREALDALQKKISRRGSLRPEDLAAVSELQQQLRKAKDWLEKAGRGHLKSLMIEGAVFNEWTSAVYDLSASIRSSLLIE